MKTNTKNIILFPLNVLHRISPATTLKIMYRLKQGRKLDLKNPKTYTEKLQCVKLDFKHPLLTKLVDKYTVREYIGEKAPEILTNLLWEGFDARKIPWDSLPNKFVMKATHGSGFNIICHDKSKLDREQCVKTLNGWLKEKFLRCYGEWFYGVEKPRIIIEEFLDAGEGKVPADYKIFCFNGQPHYICVDTDRFEDHKRTFYDTNWMCRDEVFYATWGHAVTAKPEKLDELLRYAKILSEGFPHVRVDLYLVNDHIYFGEMTFTNGAGFDRIRPYSFDEELGSLFDLGE